MIDTLSSALAQARQHVAADARNARVLPAYRSLLFEPTGTAKGAILMLPGYTSPTEQFADLGRLMAGRGYYSFIPRAPRHGLEDAPVRIAPTAAELRTYGQSSLAVVAGLAPGQTGVMGLSGGATLAVWLAAHANTPLKRLVIFNPFFEPAHNLVPKWQLRGLLTLYGRLRWLPDRPDPLSDNRSYYGLASYLMLAGTLPRRPLPELEQAALVTSPGDDQVDIGLAQRWFRQWYPHGRQFELPATWQLAHDITGRSSLKGHDDTLYEAYADIYEGKASSLTGVDVH